MTRYVPTPRDSHTAEPSKEDSSGGMLLTDKTRNVTQEKQLFRNSSLTLDSGRFMARRQWFLA